MSGEEMQEVNKFKYLGMIISADRVWGWKWLIGYWREGRYGG